MQLENWHTRVKFLLWYFLMMSVISFTKKYDSHWKDNILWHNEVKVKFCINIMYFNSNVFTKFSWSNTSTIFTHCFKRLRVFIGIPLSDCYIHFPLHFSFQMMNDIMLYVDQMLCNFYTITWSTKYSLSLILTFGIPQFLLKNVFVSRFMVNKIQPH